jgi:ATP-dependent RNA helicase RhlE
LRASFYIGIYMTFIELGLSERIAGALAGFGFTEPTEIQEKVVPMILGGRDIMASAETGSGKTAAYALPIIQSHASRRARDPRILVLVPTRELALQVQSQFQRFATHTGLRTVAIYGGTGYESQTRCLRRGVDVIVATPGRLFDHMTRGNANLSGIDVLVLDEADRMLDMGFAPQVRQIVAKAPRQRQTLMFSATISKAVEGAAAEYLDNPVTIRVNTNQVHPSSIDQRIYHVDESGKAALLLQLLTDQPDVNSVLVFARTRSRAARIRKNLCASNVAAEEIHGDISQSRREKTLSRYRDGLFSVLVATDVAARGLDIPTISHVVNYDLPNTAADYVHRIGRTGRAGRSGIALSFVSADQRHLIADIETMTGRQLDPDGARRSTAPRRFRPARRRTAGDRW